MATITEDYVSFETAKLLKEKGFDIVVRYYYQKIDDDITYHIGDFRNWNVHDMWYSMPTHQMAMRWLREEHNIHIDICSIWDILHWLYQVFVITPRTARNPYVDKILYTSYEQAIEAAILYTLKNLI